MSRNVDFANKGEKMISALVFLCLLIFLSKILKINFLRRVNIENTLKMDLSQVHWLVGTSLNSKNSSDALRRQSIDPRCLSCFVPFVAEPLSEESVQTIISATISHFLRVI